MPHLTVGFFHRVLFTCTMTCFLSFVWTMTAWGLALTPPMSFATASVGIHDAVTGESKLMRTMPAFRGCDTGCKQ